jgi:drug/metabolite transporter (DMT)-like permease
MKPPAISRRLAADLALLAVAGFWGLTFPFGKIVLSSLGPFAYLAARFGIASVALILVTPLVVAPRRRAAGSRRAWAPGAALGGVLFLGYALQTAGLRLTTASKSGFITGLSVALVPVISAVWVRRPPRPGVLAAVAAATIGLALLTLDESVSLGLGDVLTLGCAFCFALHIVLVGRLTGALEPVSFATAQIASVTVLSLLAAPTEHPLRALHAAPPAVWAMIAFMAVTGTIGAFLIQMWAQRHTSASDTGLMFTFEPVAAALAAYLILGEVLSGRQALGAALILAGIALAALKPDATRQGSARAD